MSNRTFVALPGQRRQPQTCREVLTNRMSPWRRLTHRLGVAVLTVLLVVPLTVGPVAAWSNSSANNYGTHDWVLDQAFRLLDARGISISWVDRTRALHATDDPDNIEVEADPSRSIEHVYTGDGGKRGGAVHRITEHYAKMVRLHDAGDYAEASYHLGMLAHFYGDVLQPYHTSRDAIDMDTNHHAYELLVNSMTKTPTSQPSWSVANSSWNVKALINVRSASIAAAAYSRARYAELEANFDAGDSSLSSAAANVTKEVLIRASGDLANLIVSVPSGSANPPVVGSIKVWMKWQGVKPNEPVEAAFATVMDTNGKPIEGVEVKVTTPVSPSSTKTLRFWTDGTGTGHITYALGDFTTMAKQTVTLKVTTDQTTVSKSTWFFETKKLADGSTGFRTTVNDRTVKAGQTVTVTSTVRSTSGAPIAGLYVKWTWTMGSVVRTSSGYTNADGVAKSSYTILSTTTRSEIHVHAGTSAYSINRNSNAYFQRTD